MNLVIFGPPGAGKGTQAGRLAADRGVPHISTGDILRAAIKTGTALGRRAQAIVDAGELMSDDVMVAIVRDRLTRADVAPGFVLDGFPRTAMQATALDSMIEGRGALTIVELVVSDDAIVERLSRRRMCATCKAIYRVDEHGEPTVCTACGGHLELRRDDREDVVRERLRVYHRETAPLVEFYHARAGFVSVDGNQPPDAVADAIGAAIDEVTAPDRSNRTVEARL